MADQKLPSVPVNTLRDGGATNDWAELLDNERVPDRSDWSPLHRQTAKKTTSDEAIPSLKADSSPEH